MDYVAAVVVKVVGDAYVVVGYRSLYSDHIHRPPMNLGYMNFQFLLLPSNNVLDGDKRLDCSTTVAVVPYDVASVVAVVEFVVDGPNWEPRSLFETCLRVYPWHLKRPWQRDCTLFSRL